MKYSGPLGLPRLTGKGPLTVRQEVKQLDKSFVKFLVRQYGTDLDVSSEAIQGALDMVDEIPMGGITADLPEANIAGGAVHGGSGFTGENVPPEDISDISGVPPEDISQAWLFIKDEALGLSSNVMVVLPTSGQDIQTPDEQLFMEVMTGSETNMATGIVDRDRVDFVESRTIQTSAVPNDVNLDRSRAGSTIDILMVGLEPELEPSEAPRVKVRMSQRLNQSTFYTTKITEVESAAV
jgi:hypothetical protein